MLNISDLRFTVDFPVCQREKWAREFPPWLCALEVGCQNGKPPLTTEQLAMRFAALVELWRRENELVFVAPFNVFMNDRKLSRSLEEARVSREDIHLVSGGDILVCCRTCDTVAHVIEKCKCERMTIFFSDDDAKALETMKQVDCYPLRYKIFGVPYVARAEFHGGFIFYEETHEGMTILGTRRFIIDRCLRRLMDLPGDTLSRDEVGTSEKESG